MKAIYGEDACHASGDFAVLQQSVTLSSAVVLGAVVEGYYGGRLHHVD